MSIKGIMTARKATEGFPSLHNALEKKKIPSSFVKKQEVFLLVIVILSPREAAGGHAQTLWVSEEPPEEVQGNGGPTTVENY